MILVFADVGSCYLDSILENPNTEKVGKCPFYVYCHLTWQVGNFLCFQWIIHDCNYSTYSSWQVKSRIFKTLIQYSTPYQLLIILMKRKCQAIKCSDVQLFT